MELSVSDIFFYLIAGFILITAGLAVTSRKIFRSAIYLLFSMIGIASLYFWMNFPFIAAVQIIVYVGGIVVLIIFSIFLTHHVGSEMEPPVRSRLPVVIVTCLVALAGLIWLLYDYFIPAAAPDSVELTPQEIGRQMLSLNEHGYILPFEVVSILLLAAMVGCIVIAMKPKLAP